MSQRMIFINLPVKDLEATRAFWAGLGFGFNEQFSGDTAACMVVEQNICAMFLTEDNFRTFINGEIADPETTEVLTCLSAGSREEIDDTVAKAIAAGGSEWRPVIDQSFMYGHSFRDIDGHVWELMWMDMDAVPHDACETTAAATSA